MQPTKQKHKRERRENQEKRQQQEQQFDKLFVDTLLPHLSYEALYKLCQCDANVASYVTMKQSLLWYRKAFQFMQDCGYDAGTTHVDDLNIISTARFGYRSQRGKKVPSIEAGKTRVVSWNVSPSSDAHAGICNVRFCLEIDLMTGYRKYTCSNGRRRDNSYLVSWIPEKKGIIQQQQLSLKVVLHRNGSLDVQQQTGEQHIDHSTITDFEGVVLPNNERLQDGFDGQSRSATKQTTCNFVLESCKTSTFAQRCLRTYGKNLTAIALKRTKNESIGTIRLLSTFVATWKSV